MVDTRADGVSLDIVRVVLGEEGMGVERRGADAWAGVEGPRIALLLLLLLLSMLLLVRLLAGLPLPLLVELLELVVPS